MKIFKKIGTAFSNLKFDIRKNASHIAVYGGLAGVVLGAGGLVWATVKTVEDKYEKPELEKKERIEKALKRYIGPSLMFIGGGTSIVWGYNRKVGEAVALAELASTALTSYNYAHEVAGDDSMLLTQHFDNPENEEEVTSVSVPAVSFVEVFDETTSDFFEDSYDHDKGVHTAETIKMNLDIVGNIVSRWNDIMRERNGRPVYWNEIRADLGMENLKYGQFAGWRFDPNRPTGDNYIDLRPHVLPNRKLGIDSDGYTILFDPNFDGSVLEYEVN